MTAEPVIDAPAGRVRLGDNAYPFALDSATGAATLAAGERRWSVRPLRWREKLTLARFTHAGPGFIAEQMLRACVSGGDPPGEPELRTIVTALVAWVGGPADTVPLAPPALATVTLELCRALGCPPADLDQLDAVDVEAMWRAAVGARAAVEPDAGDGVTRVLVVPDPSPDAEAEDGDAAPPDDRTLAGPARGTLSERPDTAGEPREAALAPPPARPRRREPRERRGSGPGFRVLDPATDVTARPRPYAAAALPGCAEDAPRPPAAAPLPGRASARLADVSPPRGRTASLAPTEAPRVDVPPPASAPVARRASTAAWEAGETPALGAPPLAPAVGTRSPELDLDALCEELVARLEEAVEHAGILTGA
jgi:hypothetical protein